MNTEGVESLITTTGVFMFELMDAVNSKNIRINNSTSAVILSGYLNLYTGYPNLFMTWILGTNTSLDLFLFSI